MVLVMVLVWSWLGFQAVLAWFGLVIKKLSKLSKLSKLGKLSRLSKLSQLSQLSKLTKLSKAPIRRPHKQAN